MSRDASEIPLASLTIGPEISRGAEGVVHSAVYAGSTVCMKVVYIVLHDPLCAFPRVAELQLPWLPHFSVVSVVNSGCSTVCDTLYIGAFPMDMLSYPACWSFHRRVTRVRVLRRSALMHSHLRVPLCTESLLGALSTWRWLRLSFAKQQC